MSPAPAAGPDEAFAWPWPEAALLLGWLLCTAGWRPLFLPDEARHAGMAFEMLRAAGGWAAWWPTLNGLPQLNEAPLLPLLNRWALEGLGVHAFAVRVAPALLGAGLCLSMFLHARRCHGQPVARLSLLMLATCPLLFVAAQFTSPHIAGAAFTTASVLAFVRALDDAQPAAWRWPMLAWALCAFGVLAQGPAGLVVPLAVIGPWVVVLGRWRQGARCWHPAGLLVFMALLGPLVAALVWLDPATPAALAASAWHEPLRQIVSAPVDGALPAAWVLAALPLLSFPWSPWLLALRPARLMPAGASHVRPLLALYGWWMLVALAWACRPGARSVGDVLPALAPLFLLLGLVLSERRTPWWRVAFPAAATCVCALVFMVSKAPQSHRELAQTLATQMQPGDRVVFVDDFPFDVPFYAGLREPVIVLTDWDAAAASPPGDWRARMLQALPWVPGRASQPVARAAWMWGWQRLPEVPCHASSVWLFAGSEHRDRLEAAMAGLLLVQVERGVDLISVPRRDCVGGVPVAASGQPDASRLQVELELGRSQVSELTLARSEGWVASR